MKFSDKVSDVRIPLVWIIVKEKVLDKRPLIYYIFRSFETYFWELHDAR